MIVSPYDPNGLTTGTLPYCAIVVTYRAVAFVVNNIIKLVQECGRVIVVDNGSEEEVLSDIDAVVGVELIRFPSNVGLASALNAGINRALDLGYNWAITFDQDSTPEPGFGVELWKAHLRYPEAGIVAPRIKEAAVNEGNYAWTRKARWSPFLFERVFCSGVDIPGITVAITSGALTELRLWRELGGFEVCLFIDYIDVDYCLRVRRAGRDIVVSHAAVLNHELGARRSKIIMGHEFRPTFHSALRHYYIARNRVFVWKKHALSVPHWALFDLSYCIYNFLRVVLFEDRKMEKIRATIVGTYDGLKARFGPVIPGRI